MKDAIRNFPLQFAFEPVVVNEDRWTLSGIYIVAGMGGSHLAADLIASLQIDLDLIIHSDYGLPLVPQARLQKAGFIASSYSGNTEEVIDGLNRALKRNMPCAVVAAGGELLARATSERLAYVQLPDTGIQPRSALGYSMNAILKLTGQDELLRKAKGLATLLDPLSQEPQGKAIAEWLSKRIPLIYSSERNRAIAYNWKIKFNETGKIPTFYNNIPELNHNEMTGFDMNDATSSLSQRFSLVLIRDTEDDARVQKRMDILAAFYEKRGIPAHSISLEGGGRLERIFKNLLIADWAAFWIATNYGADPEQVPMVEEFKRALKQ